jgi:hypothetical protein
VDSGSGAPAGPALVNSNWIVEASSQAVELDFNEAGERDVSRHNPYHNPYSHLARRHSDVGPQPSLGVRAFWNCRPHPYRSSNPGPAWQTLVSHHSGCSTFGGSPPDVSGGGITSSLCPASRRGTRADVIVVVWPSGLQRLPSCRLS